jgi:hypothetical protein
MEIIHYHAQPGRVAVVAPLVQVHLLMVVMAVTAVIQHVQLLIL